MKNIEIHFSSPLRKFVEGKAVLPLTADTVKDAVVKIETLFPGIKASLRNKTEKLNSFVGIYIAGKNIKNLKGLETELNHGDQLSIVVAVAGG